MDAPPLSPFSQSPPPTYRRTSITSAPKHFILRSIKNIRQGNLTLLVLFCACLIIFIRALMGAGYNEGLSADADARLEKHPSLLNRWGPQSQKKLEQKWAELRKTSGAGLWAPKLSKDDAGHLPWGGHRGEDALHWLHAMEDKAMGGLGRRQVAKPEVPRKGKGKARVVLDHDGDHVEAPTASITDTDSVASVNSIASSVPVDGANQVLLGDHEPSPASPAEETPLEPEHAITEDLDEHDAPDDEHGKVHIAIVPAEPESSSSSIASDIESPSLASSSPAADVPSASQLEPSSESASSSSSSALSAEEEAQQRKEDAGFEEDMVFPEHDKDSGALRP